jgi:hypothetical protein
VQADKEKRRLVLRKKFVHELLCHDAGGNLILRPKRIVTAQ